MKEIIHTKEAPAAIGPYSQAVKHGSMLFTSGQIPLDPVSGEIVDGDITVQTTRVLDNLVAVLKAGGASVDKVVKTTCFLDDMADFCCVQCSVYDVLHRRCSSQVLRCCRETAKGCAG